MPPLPSPTHTLCSFSKNASSRERVKHWFFVTFNIINFELNDGTTNPSNNFATNLFKMM